MYEGYPPSPRASAAARAARQATRLRGRRLPEAQVEPRPRRPRRARQARARPARGRRPGRSSRRPRRTPDAGRAHRAGFAPPCPCRRRPVGAAPAPSGPNARPTRPRPPARPPPRARREPRPGRAPRASGTRPSGPCPPATASPKRQRVAAEPATRRRRHRRRAAAPARRPLRGAAGDGDLAGGGAGHLDRGRRHLRVPWRGEARRGRDRRHPGHGRRGRRHNVAAAPRQPHALARLRRPADGARGAHARLMWAILAAALLGAGAGVLSGLFGVGGGILFVPTLTLVLGLSQIHAEATSLLAILPTAAVGVWRQRQYGNVRWRAALILGVAALAGVEGGVQIAEQLPQDVLRRLFGALMLLVAAQVAFRALRKPAYSSEP